MIAKIKTADGFYDSIVFAIYNKGWATEVLVLNRDYTALQFVKVWIPDRNVVIYNADKEGWIIKRKFEGYDWVFQNVTRKLFKTKINEVILDKCKELQARVEECEWFEIKNKTDIDGLMYASLSFHDSYVEEMYVESGKQYIRFDTTWGCEILFELEEDIETNLFKNYGAIAIGGEFFEIYDAVMFFENNLIYWVDDESLASSDEIQKNKAYYFCAKNVKWKFIINDSAIWGKIES